MRSSCRFGSSFVLPLMRVLIVTAFCAVSLEAPLANGIPEEVRKAAQDIRASSEGDPISGSGEVLLEWARKVEGEAPGLSDALRGQDEGEAEKAFRRSLEVGLFIVDAMPALEKLFRYGGDGGRRTAVSTFSRLYTYWDSLGDDLSKIARTRKKMVRRAAIDELTLGGIKNAERKLRILRNLDSGFPTVPNFLEHVMGALGEFAHDLRKGTGSGQEQIVERNLREAAKLAEATAESLQAAQQGRTSQVGLSDYDVESLLARIRSQNLEGDEIADSAMEMAVRKDVFNETWTAALSTYLGNRSSIPEFERYPILELIMAFDGISSTPEIMDLLYDTASGSWSGFAGGRAVSAILKLGGDISPIIDTQKAMIAKFDELNDEDRKKLRSGIRSLGRVVRHDARTKEFFLSQIGKKPLTVSGVVAGYLFNVELSDREIRDLEAILLGSEETWQIAHAATALAPHQLKNEDIFPILGRAIRENSIYSSEILDVIASLRSLRRVGDDGIRSILEPIIYNIEKYSKEPEFISSIQDEILEYSIDAAKNIAEVSYLTGDGLVDIYNRANSDRKYMIEDLIFSIPEQGNQKVSQFLASACLEKMGNFEKEDVNDLFKDIFHAISKSKDRAESAKECVVSIIGHGEYISKNADSELKSDILASVIYADPKNENIKMYFTEFMKGIKVSNFEVIGNAVLHQQIDSGFFLTEISKYFSDDQSYGNKLIANQVEKFKLDSIPYLRDAISANLGGEFFDWEPVWRSLVRAIRSLQDDDGLKGERLVTRIQLKLGVIGEIKEWARIMARDLPGRSSDDYRKMLAEVVSETERTEKALLQSLQILQDAQGDSSLEMIEKWIANPWVKAAAVYPSLLCAVFLFWLAAPAKFLIFALWLQRDGRKIRYIGLPLAYVLAIEHLSKSKRVVDAWVGDRLDNARRAYEILPTVRQRANRVPRPADIQLPGQNRRPTRGNLETTELRDLFGEKVVSILVTGTGGVGKTSLAVKMGEMAMSSDKARRLFVDHAAIPILIEESFGAGDALVDMIAARLRELTGDEGELSRTLVNTLLRRKRVLVIIDHLSELPDKCVGAISATRERLNAVVVTSRNQEGSGLTNPTRIYPAPLQVKEITGFIEDYMDNVRIDPERGEIYDGFDPEPMDPKDAEGIVRASSLFDDAAFAGGTATLVRLAKKSAITPFLASRFTLAMIGSAKVDGVYEHQADENDRVPKTLPSVANLYVKGLHTNPVACAAELSAVLAGLRVASELYLGSDFRPGTGFTQFEVVGKFKELYPEYEENAACIVDYLRKDLMLLVEEGVDHTGETLKVSLDPLAENLAAQQFIRACGPSRERWTGLQDRIREAAEAARDHSDQASVVEFVLLLSACAEAKIEEETEIKMPEENRVPSSIPAEFNDLAKELTAE